MAPRSHGKDAYSNLHIHKGGQFLSESGRGRMRSGAEATGSPMTLAALSCRDAEWLRLASPETLRDPPSTSASQNATFDAMLSNPD